MSDRIDDMIADADLIARLEKATGPDRELDALVHIRCRECAVRADAVTSITIGTGTWVCYNAPGVAAWYDDIPAYTDSLDAAMTAIPEGWWLRFLGEVRKLAIKPGQRSEPYGTRPKFEAEIYSVEYRALHTAHFGTGQTAARALLAAILRAKEATDGR